MEIAFNIEFYSLLICFFIGLESITPKKKNGFVDFGTLEYVVLFWIQKSNELSILARIMRVASLTIAAVMVVQICIAPSIVRSLYEQ